MSNNYLVIKLKGSWLDKESTKGMIKFLLPTRADIHNLEVLNDENVIECCAVRSMLKEDCIRYKDAKDRIKESIAVAMGKHLLESGLICFNEIENANTTKIIGKITVINEAPKGGAE